MNIFNNEDNNRLRIFLRWLPLIMGIFIVCVFISGVNYVSDSSITNQQESLAKALARDTAQCYAVEGSYPPSLNYIVDHYGLTYNEELFYVDYQPIGGNIYPDITIIRLTDNEDKSWISKMKIAIWSMFSL